jgi:hypothetical protein
LTRTPGSVRGAAGNGGPYRHSSQGSAYARFRRALGTGNLTIIRAAAAELPHVDLGDALTVCVAIREAEPERFERAALRWLARFCTEHRGASVGDVRAAAAAFQGMATDPAAALDALRRLCEPGA